MLDSKLFTPLIFFVAAALIFLGGVWQQINAVQSLGAQLSRADAAVKQAEGGNTEQSQLVDSWQNLDGALKDRVNLGLPSTSDFPNVLLLLDDAAVSSGLLVGNIGVVEIAQSASVQPSSSEATASAPKLPSSLLVSINARGDYPSIKAFVQSIQKEERVMDVQSIDISPFGALSGSASSKIFELTATLKVYYGQ